MNVLDAAYEVLREAGEGLHYRELTERMVARGLWVTNAKRPWETVNARLAVDVKARGEASRFRRVAPAIFAINDAETEQRPIPSAVDSRADAGSMSFTDAAARILRESGTREPLHYTDLTRRALERGLIRTEGVTPEATMYSVILQEVRRREARGERQRFVQHGKGLVGLASWLPTGLVSEIEEHNRGVRTKLLQRLRTGSPGDFEELVAQLLVALGFEDVSVTSLGGDGGIDVRGTLVVGEVVRIRMAVQAKRWKANVLAPVVQQVRGSLGAHEQGLIITTSDFSSGAREEAARPDASPVALMNGEQLAALLAEYELGVHRERHDLFSLDEPDDPERSMA